MHKWLENYVKLGTTGDPGSNPYSQQSHLMAQSIIKKGLTNCNEFWGTEVSLYYPEMYAGTTDLVGIHNGSEAIMDHKQANKMKKREWIEDYFIQTCAYATAHNQVWNTSIRKGVIFMCTKDNEYQEFIIEGKEFDHYVNEWFKRLEQYYYGKLYLMAIIQISKIQQRSGNLVDLPQLSEAEFGWASDEKQLFIGKETPNENIEVLTSYSEIDFSQIEGSIGNLNISNTVANGQVLAYDGNNWVNRGGSAGGLITLGNVSNVRITGGAINYILTTDGLGNLSWTPKGALYSNIVALSNATPIVMTVANTTPYVNDSQVTITGVLGVANSNVKGLTFYVQLASNFPTTGNVSLYTSAGGSGPANGTSLTYTNSPNAIATSTIGSGSGSGVVGGTTNSVQYNDGSGFQGDANFTWNGSTLTVTGNTNISNLLNVSNTITASRLVSNIAIGTPPLTVTSTTKVVNLNADLLDGYDTSVASAATTVVVRDASANILANNVNTNRIFNGTSNVAIIAGGNVSITVASTETIRATTTGAEVFGNLLASNVYANSGTVGASLLTGTLTTAAQPNITSVGTLTSLAVTGNITSANITTSTHVIRSVATAISAAGTVQGDATALAKDINVVSTVSAGQGVRLPTAVAGLVIIVNNTSATSLNVYPSTSAAINSLATNAAYTHIAAASLQYYAISATQWYTVGATYS
jgi:hypothetical protein